MIYVKGKIYDSGNSFTIYNFIHSS